MALISEDHKRLSHIRMTGIPKPIDTSMIFDGGIAKVAKGKYKYYCLPCQDSMADDIPLEDHSCDNVVTMGRYAYHEYYEIFLWVTSLEYPTLISDNQCGCKCDK